MSTPVLPAGERGKTLWLAGLFLLLVVAVYSDPLFLRRNFGSRDPLGYHYPLEKAIHDAYARGRLPVWISEISGGRPLLANPNVGALYPVRPLLCRVPFHLTIRLFPVLHWAGAGIGIILLLRVIGVSLAGAWIGAVTYVFSGVSVSEVFYPNIHPGMALLPWALWALARPASGSARGTLTLSFVWLLLFLAGDIFAMSLALLASLLWILMETERAQRALRSWRLAAAIGLAVLAAAPQIVASALWIPETNRAVLGLRLGEAITFSISPFRLLELVVPFPFGTAWDLERAQMWGFPIFHYRQLGFFTSLYAGTFAVIALVTTWKSRAGDARFARALLWIGLALSVPPSLFPASWNDLHSPLPLRYPEKFAVLLVLALAVLAGLGFDALRRERRLRWPLWSGAVLAGLGAVTAVLPGPSGRLAVHAIGAEAGLAGTAGRLLPGAFAEAGLLWIATVVALEALPRGTRLSLLACLAILTLVPIAANRKIALTFPEEQLFAPSPFDRFLRHVDPRQDYRTLDESVYLPPTSLAGLGHGHGRLRRGVCAPYLVPLLARSLGPRHCLQPGPGLGRSLPPGQPPSPLLQGGRLPRFSRLLRRAGAQVGNPDARSGAAGRISPDPRQRVRGLGRARGGLPGRPTPREMARGDRRDPGVEQPRAPWPGRSRDRVRRPSVGNGAPRDSAHTREDARAAPCRGRIAGCDLALRVARLLEPPDGARGWQPGGRRAGAARLLRRPRAGRPPHDRLERGGPGSVRFTLGAGPVRDRRSRHRGARQRPEAMIRRALPGALLVLLIGAIYSDPLAFRRNFAGRDLLAYNLPMEKAVHDAYERGRLPVWMPEISGGRPLLPNPNAGALYPIRPLLALVPFPLAMRIFPPLHWALAGIGVLCLLRRLGASRSGAWVGAVTYAFSGVAVSDVFFPHILPGLALLPWIVWAIARPSRTAAGKILLLSVLLALDMLAGDVFSVTAAMTCGGLWILCETEPDKRTREFALFGGAVLLAILAAAPQIVAAALWIPETGRAVVGMKLRESLLYSISPFRLLELVVPYPFGPTNALEVQEVFARAIFHQKAVGLFATLYTGAFALIGALALRRKRAGGARFGRVLALAALAVCVIPSLLPAAWGKIASPLPLRNPEKFAVGLVLALAILAGLAFDEFRRRPPRTRGLLLAGAALCLLAGAASLWPVRIGGVALQALGDPPARARLAGEKLAIGFAEGGLFWMATLLALEALRVLPRAGTATSLALLTLVPIAANRRIARIFSEEAIFARTPFVTFLDRMDPSGAYRTMGVYGYRPHSLLEEAQSSNDPGRLEYSRRNWYQYTPALWRRGMVFNGDFDSGDLSRLQSLRRVSQPAAGFRDASPFFGALALRWGIRFRDQEPLPGYHRVRGDAMMNWDEHENAYPDIRLLTSWREEEGAVAALKVLPSLAAGQVVIESEATGLRTARPGRLRILEKSPERLRIEAEAPDPTWLFVLRGYWNYRAVLVDGRPVEYAPAQLAFSAVRVPAGRHTIEWTELVPGLSVSRWGPALFVVAAALLLGYRRSQTA